jgi:hypothetical protein
LDMSAPPYDGTKKNRAGLPPRGVFRGPEAVA